VIMLYRRMFKRLKRDLSLSRTSFNNIMNSSPFVSIIVINIYGKITLFNSGSEKMLGYSQDEVKGKNIMSRLCSPSDIERFRDELHAKFDMAVTEKALIAHMAKQKEQDIESTYMCKDGSLCYVDMTMNPIIDYYGDTSGYLVVASDLTATHKAQHQLKESQKFLRSVIDAIPVRIFWKDCDSVYLGCNKVFAVDAGLVATNDIIGCMDSELPWSGELAKTFRKEDHDVLLSRHPKLNFEKSIYTINGNMITARASKLPLFDVDDKLIGVLGMYEDVSDYKRMQEIVEKRIVSLTRYIDDPDAVDFDKLFNVDEIQRIQDEFSDSTNVASVIVSSTGRFITKASRMTRLCELVMNVKPENSGGCFELTSELIKVGSDKPYFRICEGSGLSIAISPILVGGIHVASWIVGQVRIEDKDTNVLVQSAKKVGVDVEEYVKAYACTPVMAKEKFESIAKSAHTLCSQLSIFASQNIQQASYLAEEKKRTEEIMKYHTAIEQIPDGVIIINKDQRIQYANPAFTKITGYSHDEAIGMNPMVLSSGSVNDEVLKGQLDTIHAGMVWSGRLTNSRKDGSIYTEQTVISPVIDSAGKIVSVVATLRDITEEIKREEELRLRQKMSAIGQLAGGVAHDFNNILQSILGFSEILLTRFDSGSIDYKNVEHINDSAKRAAMLTRGLLALGRRDEGAENLELVDLNYLLKDSSLLIDLMSTADISIVYDLAEDLWPVSFSTNKFYQVLMNLVMNARDSMQGEGKIFIRTANVLAGELNTGDGEFGDYVCLTVEDDGCGIPEGVADKIFDPFFTTKDVGKGTGLGLSTVYINIKECGGIVRVKNKNGGGTKFFVYLPKKIG
jgi:PAS domain S-box-containing protein